MAAITVQTILETGLTPTALASASVGGDTFANDGNTFFEVTNGSGGAITVTFVVQNGTFTSKQTGILTKSNNAVSVSAGTSRKIGPFPTGVYNDTSGLVSVTYSGVTSLTVGAFKL